MRLFRPMSAVLLLLLAACSSADTETLLAAPAAGDVYAAELSAFSAFPFHDADAQPIAPAYGLLQVVAADDDGVVVITQNTASGDPRQARRDLRGDLTDIAFDDSERIRMSGPALRQAHADGRITAAHRPDPAPTP